MIVLSTLLIVACPLAIGFALMQLLCGVDKPTVITRLFQMSFGLLIGQALLGLLFHFILLCQPSWLRWSWLLETTMAALLVAIAFRVSPPCTMSFEPTSSPGRLLIVWFTIFVVAQFVVFGAMASRFPHGGWDAWENWNTKARFLAFAGDGWPAYARLEHIHADYPLLHPCMVARAYRYLGESVPLAPILVAGMTMAATAGILFSTLSLLSGNLSVGMLAAMALFGMPFVVKMHVSQYADNQIAAALLALLAISVLHNEIAHEGANSVVAAPRRRTRQSASLQTSLRFSFDGLLVIAGICLGSLLLTKNEGLLIVAAYLAVQFFRLRLREQTLLGLGLVPFVAAFLLFKTRLWAPSELTPASMSDVISKLLDSSRYVIIAEHTITTAIRFRAWNLFPFLLPLYAAVVGVDRSKIRLAVGMWVVLALVFCGYCVVYLITPYELPWHLRTSLDRLLYHLCPSMVFLTFFALKHQAVGVERR